MTRVAAPDLAGVQHPVNLVASPAKHTVRRAVREEGILSFKLSMLHTSPSCQFI